MTYRHLRQTEIKPINDDLTVEYHYGGAIVVFRIRASSQLAISAWTLELSALYEAASGPVLHMHDLSSPDAVLTPYARTCVRELQHRYPLVRGYMAVVLPTSPTAHLMRFFLNQEIVNTRPGVEVRMFPRSADGLSWLESALQSAPS